MLNIPILRWGKPYDSLEVDEVKHFSTGEPIAKVSQANAGLLQRDMRKARPPIAAQYQDLIGIFFGSTFALANWPRTGLRGRSQCAGGCLRCS